MIQTLEKEIHRLKEENELLRRYVEPEVLESVNNGDFQYLKLGGNAADVSVMFIDIRNFTTMSEKCSPETMVEILSRFLDILSDVIIKNGGVLDKFIGDAVMCFWTATTEDYVYQSVKTALDIMEDIQPVVKEVYETYGQAVTVGMGVHCGNAVVGNIGTRHRLDFTVIGDVVNTAARLESNAKDGNAILMSETVYRHVAHRLPKTAICTEISGGLQLKGKEEPFPTYVLSGTLKQHMA